MIIRAPVFIEVPLCKGKQIGMFAIISKILALMYFSFGFMMLRAVEQYPVWSNLRGLLSQYGSMLVHFISQSCSKAVTYTSSVIILPYWQLLSIIYIHKKDESSLTIGGHIYDTLVQLELESQPKPQTSPTSTLSYKLYVHTAEASVIGEPTSLLVSPCVVPPAGECYNRYPVDWARVAKPRKIHLTLWCWSSTRGSIHHELWYKQQSCKFLQRQ